MNRLIFLLLMSLAIGCQQAPVVPETNPPSVTQPGDQNPPAVVEEIPQAVTWTSLKVGDRGEEVKALQQALNGHGERLTTDGVFGPVTEAAVKRFQRANGINASGLVGPLTWTALLKLPAPPIDNPGAYEWNADWDDAIIGSVTAAQLSMTAAQMKQYCPKWSSLDDAGKRRFWADFWWAVARYESSRDPRAMYWEKTMPNDEVTGQLTISEGLLQLSYQDEKWAKCGFNWELDREKHLRDLANRPTGVRSWLSREVKTINDGPRNLRCGNKIMDYRLTKVSSLKGKPLYDIAKGYWAVVRDRTPEVITEFRKRNKACF